MIKAAALLQRTAAGTGNYGFVRAALRTSADGAARSLSTLDRR